VKAAGFEMFIRAIRAYCMSSCSRGLCLGCAFERHSERTRQVQVFVERRERIAAARRATTRAAR
jgi:hypothetical protein